MKILDHEVCMLQEAIAGGQIEEHWPFVSAFGTGKTHCQLLEEKGLLVKDNKLSYAYKFVYKITEKGEASLRSAQ